MGKQKSSPDLAISDLSRFPPLVPLPALSRFSVRFSASVPCPASVPRPASVPSSFADHDTRCPPYSKPSQFGARARPLNTTVAVKVPPSQPREAAVVGTAGLEVAESEPEHAGLQVFAV